MNEDCIKNARPHYGSVPSADEVFGFGFGAAVNGESKKCMNCKHLVGADGELCQKRKNRITDCTENINPEGGNFSPLLKLIISDKVCEKFEFEEDSDRRRENNEKEMEFLLKNLDSLKNKLAMLKELKRSAGKATSSTGNTPMVGIRIDNINIGVTKPE